MKQILLKATQLIAMIDYPPLHSPEALVGYYKKLKTGKKIEPAIVVPKNAVIEYFMRKKTHFNSYKRELEQFLTIHPAANYFMSGGKHRSAAATILGVMTPCLIVENDADVGYIHSLMKTGKITGVPSVGKDFEDTLREFEEHFYEHKRFWTMEEKTKAMVENGDIPNFIPPFVRGGAIFTPHRPP